MTNLQIDIKSADLENAMKITEMLYQLVENKEIESIQIRKIKKGANSLDINSLLPLLQNFDFNHLLQEGLSVKQLAEAYIGIRIAEKVVSMVKDGIDISEKLGKMKSSMSLHCKMGIHSIVKFGKAYNTNYSDTIVASATPESIKDTLLSKNLWGEIPLAREKYLMIKNIAFFVKTPVRAITWAGKVKNIKYNPENKKSTVFLDGEAKQIPPIPYDDKCPHHNGHGIVYTTMDRIRNAKTLCDVYPSLNP